MTPDDPILDRTTPLVPADSVAAILLDPDGHYLLQHRDLKRGIFFPGHWGCFGGAIEADETHEEAFRRELIEELALDLGDKPLTYFTRQDFDLGFAGFQRPVCRVWFELQISATQVETLQLHEGHAYRAFDWTELAGLHPVMPFDAYALWLHVNRTRLHPDTAS